MNISKLRIRHESYDLEHVESGTCVESRLFVYGSDQSRLGAFLWEKRSRDIEFETVSDLVLELDLTFKDVGSSPSLRKGQPVLFVGVFGLKVASDSRRAQRTVPSDFEDDIRRGFGFHFQPIGREGEVLAEQVVRRLAEIL